MLLPLYVEGTVVPGFGRGSKELGIPTANLSENAVNAVGCLSPGIYYGYAMLAEDDTKNNSLLPTVLSIGWNPFYKNEKKSLELHILAKVQEPLLEKLIKLQILGYLREESNFSTVEELKSAIKVDIENASKKLATSVTATAADFKILF